MRISITAILFFCHVFSRDLTHQTICSGQSAVLVLAFYEITLEFHTYCRLSLYCRLTLCCRLTLYCRHFWFEEELTTTMF